MQALKVVGLGLLFSFVGTIAYLLIDNLRQPVVRDQAIGLSAVVGGLMEATVFNPIYWLGIVLAFGLAFWLTGKSHTA